MIRRGRPEFIVRYGMLIDVTPLEMVIQPRRSPPEIQHRAEPPVEHLQPEFDPSAVAAAVEAIAKSEGPKVQGKLGRLLALAQGLKRS